MAIRTDVQDVRNCVYLSSKFTNEMVEQCIATANSLTDGVLADQDMTETTLTQIELYLSAHFCSVREPQIYEEEWGGRDSIAKEKRVKVSVGKGLNSTNFGQQAIMLDTSGILADLSSEKRKSAGIEVYGPYTSI